MYHDETFKNVKNYHRPFATHMWINILAIAAYFYVIIKKKQRV